MGNKILRAKLKGPGLAAYYPRRTVTMRDFQKELEKINLTFDNEEEEDRLDKIQE
jgi:small subunit ribosomal protein S33